MSWSPRARVLLLLSVVLAFHTGCVAAYSAHASHGTERSSFHEVLSPYGEWFVLEHYGPVWRPYRHVVGVAFTPYVTGGRWVYTEHGWVFDTDWEWGWVPFHYGRWLQLGAGDGWVWVPDTVWGPAWVEWRIGEGYVGWVPLPPPHVTVVVGAYEPLWIFVRVSEFPDGRHRAHGVFTPRPHPATAVVSPRPANDGHAWYMGPPRDWVIHEGSVSVTPRPYRGPEPLPSDAVGIPKDARMRSIPPPGKSAGAERERTPDGARPEWGAPQPSEGRSPPPGHASGGPTPVPSTPPRAEPGASPSRPPPPGQGQSPAQPPPGRSKHRGEGTPPPGKPTPWQ